MIILDSDILIDILRHHQSAAAWISSVRVPVCLPGFVAFEIYQGCFNKKEADDLRGKLAPFAILWPSEIIASQVLANYVHAHLAYSTGVLDALIAATAMTHELTLHTFNQKHFAAFPQLKTFQPYTR